jgi:hypothetical protein
MRPVPLPAPARRPSCRILSGLLLAVACPGLAMAAVETAPLPKLPANARYAIWGDSITEATPYPKFVEAYLLACAGRKDVTVCTFGHSGEQAGGLVSRESDLDGFHPTVVSYLWGMNDTRYTADTPDKDAGYEQNTRTSIAVLERHGIKDRIIVAPTYVDDVYGSGPDDAANFFKGTDGHGMTAAQGQNATLAHFRDIAKKVAADTGAAFADVHNRMEEAYRAAEKVYGPKYEIGVHVNATGALMLCHEILKALTCDGDIGTFTVDMHGGTTASAGHTVVSSKDGVVVLESTKYPFCYNADPNNSVGPNCLDTILPYLPFSQELNRLTLKVTNLDAPSADVTWGAETKTFTAEQLKAGINLASEFTHTPFDAIFGRVMQGVWEKQNYETFMTKGTANYNANDNGGNIDTNMMALDAKEDAALKALIIPVRHCLVIVPTGKTLAVPAITGTMVAYPWLGQDFSYQITALGATAYKATGLPAGLSLDAASGKISGAATAAGTSVVTLTATGAGGSATTTLTLVVLVPPSLVPEITSAKTADATVGTPFSYQITAKNDPLGYFVWMPSDKGTAPPASSLPAGLSYDSKTGVISGTLTKAGAFTLQVAAWNYGCFEHQPWAIPIGIGLVPVTVTVKDK